MNLKINLKLSIRTVIRGIIFLVALLMLLGVGILGWFLEKNFYEPLTQAPIIAELKSQVATVAVETTALKQILEAQSARLAPLPDGWTTTPNPFVSNTTNVAPTPVNQPPTLLR